MPTSGKTHSWLLPCLITLASTFVGCSSAVDLQAVQAYAKTTADARASFATVAADFSASCLRRRELTLRNADLPFSLVDLAPAYTAVPAPSPAATPALGSFNDSRCIGAQSVSAEWDKRNKIFLGYIQALGAIAGVDAQPTFEPLGDALVNGQIISQVQDTAFVNLAKTIAGIALAGEQRDAIAKTVTGVDGSLHTAIDSLKIVDDAYGQELNAEFNDTFNFYNSLIRAEIGSNPDALTMTVKNQIYGQRQIYAASLQAVNDRRASTIGYARVLEGIGKTHDQLVQAARQKLKMSDYVAIVKRDVIPLYQDVEALRKVAK